MVDIMRDQKPGDRRPMMSLISKHYSKPEASAVFGKDISKYEWNKAKKHYKHPGPMKPVPKITHHRARFNIDALITLIAHVKENHTQSHAYGDKNATTTSGACHQLDAVSLTASVEYISKEFSKKFFPDRCVLQEGSCPKCCKRSGLYCMHKQGHTGKCKFTDENMISVSSIAKVLGVLTNGQLKSRAGLDDEDVLKGSGNIIRVTEIYKKLAEAKGHSADTISKTVRKIEGIMTFHRTNFVSHLADHGVRCCQCISCGLHSKDEPVACPYREDQDKKHEGPCRDCEESFEIFSEMIDLAKSCEEIPNLSIAQKECFVELHHELQKCRINLIHWRSHIVRKVVEAKATKADIRNLKPNQAIVDIDYKMKINSIYFRETKQQFFGKRGSACLGFMVYTNQEQKETEVDVNFYFLFSDDTQQDSNHVIAGKHYIYTEVLPNLFPEDTSIEVLCATDGAGAFNSCLVKSLMLQWSVWTDGKVNEVQIRHSVNGDGKTALDGCFGKLSKNLKDYVNNTGNDITNAEDFHKACST